MQNRMKNHQLNVNQIKYLLENAEVASIATLNQDGTPYVTPIHFVYKNNKVYFHGLPKGKKIDNILMNKNVSLTIYKMDSLIVEEKGNPCNVNTKYQSVIICGQAYIVQEYQEKKLALKAIVEKYVPDMRDMDIPDTQIEKTAVVAVDCIKITGKYYG